MFAWFPYRLSVARRTMIPPPRLVPVAAGPRRLLIAGAAALSMGAAVATPAIAGSSGSLSGTISVVTMSITVSPASGNFGLCHGGNSSATQLGFPNGFCEAPVDANNLLTPISIANTGASGHVQVLGSNAVPADTGTNWTLCVPVLPVPGGVACTGPAGVHPGRDQFLEFTNPAGLGGPGTDLTSIAHCDPAINEQNLSDQCALAGGATAQEFLIIGGPTVSTDASTSFTTTATWIIVP